MSFSCYWSTGITVGDIYSRGRPPIRPRTHTHPCMETWMHARRHLLQHAQHIHAQTPFIPPLLNLSCVEKRKPGIWFFVSPFTSYPIHSVHSLKRVARVDGLMAFGIRPLLFLIGESGDPAFVQFATLPFFVAALLFARATYRYLVCPLFGGPWSCAGCLGANARMSELLPHSLFLSRSRTDSIFNISRTITYSYQRITEASLNGTVVGESRG